MLFLAEAVAEAVFNRDWCDALSRYVFPLYDRGLPGQQSPVLFIVSWINVFYPLFHHDLLRYVPFRSPDLKQENACRQP